LSWIKIYLPHQICQCAEAGNRDHCYICSCIWSFCVLGPDSTVAKQTVSIFKRSVSRILGSQCLGNVLLHRSNPNLWYAYSKLHQNTANRTQVAPRLGLTVNQDAINSVTRGLVGDTSFAVLPEVTARTTFALTLIFQIIPLIKLFLDPTWETFIGSVTLCGYASFLFGWHVHEKAILLVIIPFSLIALKDRRYLGAFRPLAVAGHVSLFPLLFTAAEFPIKTIYTIFWLVLFLLAFDRLAPASNKPRVFLLDRFSLWYIAVSMPLIVYCSLLHQVIWGKTLEFLPLMFMSSYSAVGVVGSWVGFLVVFFTS
jgi:alpha-1,3-glucosyltransferase